MLYDDYTQSYHQLKINSLSVDLQINVTNGDLTVKVYNFNVKSYHQGQTENWNPNDVYFNRLDTNTPNMSQAPQEGISNYTWTATPLANQNNTPITTYDLNQTSDPWGGQGTWNNLSNAPILSFPTSLLSSANGLTLLTNTTYDGNYSTNNNVTCLSPNTMLGYDYTLGTNWDTYINTPNNNYSGVMLDLGNGKQQDLYVWIQNNCCDSNNYIIFYTPKSTSQWPLGMGTWCAYPLTVMSMYTNWRDLSMATNNTNPAFVLNETFQWDNDVNFLPLINIKLCGKW